MHPHQNKHAAPTEEELIGLLLAFLEEQLNHEQSAAWNSNADFL